MRLEEEDKLRQRYYISPSSAAEADAAVTLDTPLPSVPIVFPQFPPSYHIHVYISPSYFLKDCGQMFSVVVNAILVCVLSHMVLSSQILGSN